MPPFTHRQESREFAGYVAATLAATLAAAVGTAAYYETRTPRSSADCPPGHVYVDWGETPQAGCMPEAVAESLGIMRAKP